MLYRVPILRLFLKLLTYLFPEKDALFYRLNRVARSLLNEVNNQQFVYFKNHDDGATFNKMMQYIKQNEPTKWVKIVAVVKETETIAKYLVKDIEVLNRAYPEIDFEFIQEEGEFTPQKVKELSKCLRIPSNFMFIGSPGDKFPYRIQEL